MANPVLNSESFDRGVPSAEPMTVGGSIGKTALLLAVCATTAGVFWGQSPVFAVGGIIVGLLVALVICFKPTTAPVLAPVYAIAEGAVIGTISSFFEGEFKGIVIQTIALTGGVFCAMLGAYQMRILRPTKMFVSVVFGATAGIFLIYFVSLALGMFGIKMPLLHDGPYTILFSLFVCVIAALNLIIDFGVIEEGANVGAPKYMEWYAAFGLLVTLVWLYFEILRLMSKLRK